MDLKGMYEAYKAKLAEARQLADQFKDKEMPKDTATQIDTILGKADEIRATIDREEKLQAGEKFMNEPLEPKAAHLGWRESGPDEGNAPVDVKSFREFKIALVTPWGVEEKAFRFNVPLAVQGKGYGPAYETYIRKGLSEMGPNDRKALSEGLDSAGGYLVPEDWQTSVLKKIATAATVRLYARIISTSRDVVKVPRRKYTTNNEYSSGVRLTWTGETPAAATAHRVTDQVYGEFNIPVGTAMASQLVSMDLIDDAAYDVIGDSSLLLGEAFALGENATFWTGNGAIQPRGLLTDIADTVNFDANMATVATANTIAADDVIDVAYALPAQYERNTRWFMTKGTEKLIRKLADTDGAYLWPIITQVGGLGTPPRELLGFPTTRDEFVHEISDGTDTTTYPLLLGDLTGYTIVDRVGLSIKRDADLYAELNQVLLLAKKRVGGQLTEAYRMSVLRSVNTS